MGAAGQILVELKRSIRENPTLHAASALADLAGGAVAAPRASLKRAAARSTGSRFVLLAYAVAAESLPDFDAAFEAVEKAAALPGEVASQRAMNRDELRDLAMELRRKAARAHLAAGRSLRSEGRLAEAILELERGYEAFHDETDLLIELAESHLAAGNFAQAEAAAGHARALLPDDRDVKLLVAAARVAAGRPEEAVPLYREILVDSPDDVDAKRGLAKAREAARRNKLPESFQQLPTRPRVTRAELAALLMENVPSLRELPAINRGVVVTDISGSWARDYILATVARGFFDVYSDHTFGGGETVSRAELADCLVRAVEAFPGHGGLDLYPPGRIEDLPRSHGLYESVVAAVGYGLLDLTESREFRPADPASGREAVDATRRLAKVLAGIE